MAEYKEYGSTLTNLAEPITNGRSSNTITAFKKGGIALSYASYNSSYSYMTRAFLKYKKSGNVLDICKKGYRPMCHSDDCLLLTLGPGTYTSKVSDNHLIIKNSSGSSYTISYHNYYICELTGGGGGGGSNFGGTEGGGGGGGFIIAAVDTRNISKFYVGSSGSGGAAAENNGNVGGNTYIINSAEISLICAYGGSGGSNNTGGSGGSYSSNVTLAFHKNGGNGGGGGDRGADTSPFYVGLNPEGSKHIEGHSGGSSGSNYGGGGGSSCYADGGSGGYLSNGSSGGLSAGGGGGDQGNFWTGKSGGNGGNGQLKIYY